MPLDDVYHVNQICQSVSEQDGYWIVALSWILKEPQLRGRIEKELGAISSADIDQSWRGLLPDLDSIIAFCSDCCDEAATLNQNIISMNGDIQESGLRLLEAAKRLQLLCQQRQTLRRACKLLNRRICDLDDAQNPPAA